MHAPSSSIVFVVILGFSTTFAKAQERNQFTDTEISAAIQADILDASRVAGGEIEVSCTSGLVTLSGTATSLHDKQMAAAIAKRTRGVNAVLNQLIVTASDRSDENIRKDIESRLKVNDSIDEPRITASVLRGEVALTGKVGSPAEKRIAELVASGVSGVTQLNNQITVGILAGRSDEDIAEEIRGLLVHSVYLDDVIVDVEVDEHVAKLSGFVPSLAAKDQAARIAEIWGVTSVDTSDLKVDASSIDESQRRERYANVTDTDISEALRRSFRNDPIVFSRVDGLEINVIDGVVNLSGRVNRLRTKSRAERLAMDVVGVRRVNNEINVEYEGDQTNDMEKIYVTQAALKRTALLDRRDIRVHCQRAHISLYGLVESELERRVAGWVADGVPGVVHVNNSLAVEKEWKKKSDKKITSDLIRKLEFTLLDRSDQVDVTVENGTVILRGEVATWREWQLAMDLALEAGARHPHNLLNVRYHPPHGGSHIFVPQ